MSEKPQRDRLRFTLRGVFAVVTLAAIGSAALAKPTELWASVVFSGTLGMLVVALLVAAVRRSAGAIGFALCGGVYLGLILAPGAETNIVPNLVTTRVLAEVESKRDPRIIDELTMLRDNQYVTAGLSNIHHPFGDWLISPFQRIGHSLFALLFAVVGSVVARWLYRSEDDRGEKERVAGTS